MKAAQQPILVTGLGAVSPLGNDVPSTWQGLIGSESAVTTLDELMSEDVPVKIAAKVRAFNPENYLDRKEARRLAAFTHYAVAATREALQMAGLDLEHEDPTRVGVEIGSALGGSSIIEEQRLVFQQRGPKGVNPSLIPAILANTAACYVSIHFGAKGPVGAPVAACATGSLAIANAARVLALGEADVMLCGGTDSVLTPLSITAFCRLGALSTRAVPPREACAPFDRDRDGTVLGEGAAVLVLETQDHASRRGARPLAELAGYGLTGDAYHTVAPDPSGEGAAHAIRGALLDAGVVADQLDWICAHGTATQMNDLAETVAIKKALGEAAYGVPVSSVKASVGHMVGAAGAISCLAAVQAILSGVLPPTLNYNNRDPQCDLDYIPNQARHKRVSHVLVNSFGFGGQNACLVFRATR
jgi:3-oxoacyl-[acyl-carrier-protein] synthase II